MDHYFCTTVCKHTNTFFCQFLHKIVRRWWSPLSGVDLENVLSRLPYKIGSQIFKLQDNIQHYTWVNFQQSNKGHEVSHLSVWQAKEELSVEPSWSSQGWVNGVQSVRSSDHNNLSSGIQPIHKSQQGGHNGTAKTGTCSSHEIICGILNNISMQTFDGWILSSSSGWNVCVAASELL